MEHKAETKQCQNCHKDFIIKPDDFGFYEKIGVQVPNLCVECRAQLRHVFRNERSFYKRNCDLCGESIITIWSPNKKTPVYCVNCWWSDKWDASEYGVDYDKNKGFFTQFKDLYEKVPKIALAGTRNVNCNYMNFAADNKNCYMLIECSSNENCINSYWIQKTKDTVDSSYTNQVELSYEVDDCHNSYGLKYSRGCYECNNSAFLVNCRGCSDCVGCINLRSKSYSIFNKQYTKEEYNKKLEELRLDTYTGVQSFQKQFDDFIKKFPRKYAEIYMSTNSTGNYAVNIKNSRACFHSYDSEDNAYSVHVWREAKDCMDCHTTGRTAENIYNSSNTGIQASNCICCSNVWSSSFVEYSIACPNSQNLFGCVSVKKGKHCILNKQHSKEEYESIKSKIINELKENLVYGEYFPREIAMFGYNETTAMEEFPLSKEEALAQGFKWEDTERGTYGKETIKINEIPDSIKDVNFNTEKEIFVCGGCNKNYRIINNEFLFYKKLLIPLPRLCPDCRHNKRMLNRGPNKLWHRKCMKEGCSNEFETSYAPERSEIVYCESCYNKEIY